MRSSVLVKVNLLGKIEGFVAHTHTQKYTTQLSHGVSSMTIKHSDRRPTPCSRNFTIPGHIVDDWVKGDCPSWERPHMWKKLSATNRIKSHVNSYDEGLGVSYENLDDDEF